MRNCYDRATGDDSRTTNSVEGIIPLTNNFHVLIHALESLLIVLKTNKVKSKFFWPKLLVSVMLFQIKDVIMQILYFCDLCDAHQASSMI